MAERPLKKSSASGLPRQFNASVDEVAAKGLDIEDLGTHKVDRDGTSLRFTDPTVGTETPDSLRSKVRVSANDSTPGNLSEKLVAGTGINIVEVNDSGDEDLRIETNDSEIDHGSLSGLGDDDHPQYTRKDTLTTKGDIYVDNGTDPVRKGVGADNQVLIARSSDPTGVDWDTLESELVSFVDTESVYDSGVNDVRTALEDIKKRKLLEPVSTASTASGTLLLTVSSNSLNIITGTATGYAVQLPDATTLILGRRFEIVNQSDEHVDVEDGSGATLFTLNAEEIATLTLEANGSAAGSWIQDITSTSAQGITSFVVEQSSAFVTSSSTDTVITGFTVTPDPGRYAVWFSGEFTISQNNRLASYTLYKAGSAVTGSLRRIQGVGSNYQIGGDTLAEISVNGSEAIDLRVAISSGNLTVDGRSLVLIRLGASQNGSDKIYIFGGE